MTPDDVRALSRAASQLAALAQPDVAAVVAALPRRPGSTATLTDLGEGSGLEMRALGKAIARARDAGIVRVEGDRISADQRGPSDAVAHLVALTPLGALLVDRPELAAGTPYGFIHGVPSGDHAQDLLALLAAQLPTTELSEAEVTAQLSMFGDDPAGLRRALVDSGLLWRTLDGARYQRQDQR